MDRLIEQLLQMESDKHRALMACDAAAYEKHVRSQLQLLDTNVDLAAAAREAPDQLDVLARLIRLNTNLLLNHFSASPVFAANGALGRSEYSAEGTLDTRPAAKFSVEA